MSHDRKLFGNLPIGKTRPLGDITDITWDVTADDSKTRLTFKSESQIENRNCSFEIDGVRRDGWSVMVMSYNDFGREYKHIAEKLGSNPNP